MQLSGLEQERLSTHPRDKPLSGDELALLAYMQKVEGVPHLPLPVKNPDNPVRCNWCPWGQKDILNTRDILNRRARKIIERNKLRSQDFSREVLIHLGFTLPEVLEREKIAMGLAGMNLAQFDIDQMKPPTTQTMPVLTTQQPARTIPLTTAPPPTKKVEPAALIPWALLAMSVFRTFFK